MNTRKIIVITSESQYAIGNLFVKALRSLGYEVIPFDLFKAVAGYIKGGPFGRKVNTFWPVEAWHRKANRELAVMIQQYRPDHILISGDNPVQIGTLAFAKSILPQLKVTLFWPDTLVNLSTRLVQLHPMIDTLASYSRTALPLFEAMGFKHAVWMPFAGDSDFLQSQWVDPENQVFRFDCTFIGGWRPEREEIMARIEESIPEISMKIVGPGWSKNVKRKKLIPFVDDSPKYGRAFGDFLRASRINLNIIDDTNYPAANMRFFEIPAAGGLQLSSPCPEQENIFIEGKHLFYYRSPDTVVERVQYILLNQDLASEVRLAGYDFVNMHHTYIERLKQII